MSREDRAHWDRRYAEQERGGEPRPPSAFVAHVDLFPSTGSALEIACGDGLGSLWLAQRGLHVTGFDVSPIAIVRANGLAEELGLSDRCEFITADLDDGLPAEHVGDRSFDVVMCHLFSDEGLDDQLIASLKPRAILAIGTLSEVDAQPGRFRTPPGELRRRFGKLEILVESESAGIAMLLARSK